MLQFPEQWGWVRVHSLGVLGKVSSGPALFLLLTQVFMECLEFFFPPINNGLVAELQPLHSPGIPAENAEGVLQAQEADQVLIV